MGRPMDVWVCIYVLNGVTVKRQRKGPDREEPVAAWLRRQCPEPRRESTEETREENKPTGQGRVCMPVADGGW
ncbi:hypothetical protein MTP99_010548 [Tenebrio molitor]|nr:hypothetical protein MTP99_010548 [Tenebrio molitor]